MYILERIREQRFGLPGLSRFELRRATAQAMREDSRRKAMRESAKKRRARVV